MDGEIGRRTGLKILGTSVREGSSPSLRMALWRINRTGTLSDTKIRYEPDTGRVAMKFVSNFRDSSIVQLSELLS